MYTPSTNSPVLTQALIAEKLAEYIIAIKGQQEQKNAASFMASTHTKALIHNLKSRVKNSIENAEIMQKLTSLEALEKRKAAENITQLHTDLKNITMGMCNGLSLLWLYCQWLQKNQGAAENIINYDWFVATISRLMKWNGKLDSLTKQNIADFDILFNHVVALQAGNITYGAKSQTNVATYMEHVVKQEHEETPEIHNATTEYSIELLCNLEELKQLLNYPGLIQGNKAIRITSRLSLHVIGLFVNETSKNEKTFYLFDANKFNFDQKGLKNIDELATQIAASLFKVNAKAEKLAAAEMAAAQDGYYDISFTVVSFAYNQALDYPNQADIIKTITKNKQFSVEEIKFMLQNAITYNAPESIKYLLQQAQSTYTENLVSEDADLFIPALLHDHVGVIKELLNYLKGFHYNKSVGLCDRLILAVNYALQFNALKSTQLILDCLFSAEIKLKLADDDIVKISNFTGYFNVVLNTKSFDAFDLLVNFAFKHKTTCDLRGALLHNFTADKANTMFRCFMYTCKENTLSESKELKQEKIDFLIQDLIKHNTDNNDKIAILIVNMQAFKQATPAIQQFLFHYAINLGTIITKQGIISELTTAFAQRDEATVTESLKALGVDFDENVAQIINRLYYKNFLEATNWFDVAKEIHEKASQIPEYRIPK